MFKRLTVKKIGCLMAHIQSVTRGSFLKPLVPLFICLENVNNNTPYLIKSENAFSGLPELPHILNERGLYLLQIG